MGVRLAKWTKIDKITLALHACMFMISRALTENGQNETKPRKISFGFPSVVVGSVYARTAPGCLPCEGEEDKRAVHAEFRVAQHREL